MVAKQTRRTVTTKNGRYQVSLLHPVKIRDLKMHKDLDPVHWYDVPRKRKPCPAYGVRVWTYKVTDTENPNCTIEIDTGWRIETNAEQTRGWPVGLCISAVRITGKIETIQLPVAELLQACCRVGAVTATSYPPGSTLPDGRTTGKTYEKHYLKEHDAIHADDVGRVSGFGYNERLGAQHPETKAQALRLANEHKSKGGAKGTKRTQREYLAERMTAYSVDSCMAALKAARRDEKNKPKKRKTQ